MSISTKLVTSLAIVLVALSTASAAPNQTKVRKIVRFNANMTSETRNAVMERVGAETVHDSKTVHSRAVIISEASAHELDHQPGVVNVEDDIVIDALRTRPTPTPSPNATFQSIPWGINRIGATSAWSHDTGTSVKVGIIDTGIDLTHPDLQNNIRGGVNTINAARSANDDNGHGTHVAGIVAAANNSQGVVGVGPQIDLYAIKVLGSGGSGYVSDIIEGIDWALANHIQVINLSLGTRTDISALHDAVKRARDAGIITVAAAGNDSGGPVSYPAAYSEVIAVSATSSNDSIASFSSSGPEIALAAPGQSIISAYKGGKYRSLSGTSMASPHVTGAVAMLLATPQCHSCSPNDVLSRLEATADDEGASGRDAKYGYGIVNVNRAVSY